MYKFHQAEENIIYIMDIRGRVIETYHNLTSVGMLQYNTTALPNGIYFVVAHSGNNLKLAEKLVIIK
ncbi:MAG: T9SS type A sorting domain-containing protein [Bacteroidia bacterium]